MALQQAFKSFNSQKAYIVAKSWIFGNKKTFIMSADFIQLFPISEVYKSLRDLQHQRQYKKL